MLLDRRGDTTPVNGRGQTALGAAVLRRSAASERSLPGHGAEPAGMLALAQDG